MQHFLTLILLTDSLQYFNQTARDSEPAAPLVAQIVAAQLHKTGQDTTRATRTDTLVYACDSNTAKAYHSSQNCRELDRCTHEVAKVTKKEAEEEYGRVPCQVCY